MLDRRLDPSVRAVGAMALALRRAGPDEEVNFQTFNHIEADPIPLPRFPTGIQPLDAALGGGFYGVSVIASESGVGKTLAAFRTAATAACNPDNFVVWFSAELDPNAMAERFAALCAASPELKEAASRLVVIHASFGCTPQTMTHDFEDVIDPFAKRYLVVLDSINTISDNDTGAYLDRLKKFALWAMRSRILAPADLSWLLVAETARHGGIKGGKIQFWSDVVLRIKGEKEKGVVNLEITKSRNGGEGDLGKFLRDWRRQNFIQADAARRLYAVNQGWEDL